MSPGYLPGDIFFGNTPNVPHIFKLTTFKL